MTVTSLLATFLIVVLAILFTRAIPAAPRYFDAIVAVLIVILLIVLLR